MFCFRGRRWIKIQAAFASNPCRVHGLGHGGTKRGNDEVQLRVLEWFARSDEILRGDIYKNQEERKEAIVKLFIVKVSITFPCCSRQSEDLSLERWGIVSWLPWWEKWFTLSEIYRSKTKRLPKVDFTVGVWRSWRFFLWDEAGTKRVPHLKGHLRKAALYFTTEFCLFAGVGKPSWRSVGKQANFTER